MNGPFSRNPYGRLVSVETDITNTRDITNQCAIRQSAFSFNNGYWLFSTATANVKAKSALIPLKKGNYYKITVAGNDRFGVLLLPYNFTHTGPYSVSLERGFLDNTIKEYSFYSNSDYAFACCYYNSDQDNPTITIMETEFLNKVETDRYNFRENLVASDIDQMLETRVTNYIGVSGLFIDGVAATREEIKEWLLNRNTCIYRGKLHKSGKTILDKDNNSIDLQGCALFHVPDLVPTLHTYETLKCLKYWGVNVVRLPIYLLYHPQFDTTNVDMFCRGYTEVPEFIKETMDTIIDWCVELGLYVLVDFHCLAGDDDVNAYTAYAVDFFTHFTTKYGTTDNVLYEILNEPHRNAIATLAPYLSTVVPIIRANVVNPIMVMGRSILTDDVVATVYPWMLANGYDDIFLSCHSYFGDESALVATYEAWWAADIPLFVSEWGNCAGSGYAPRDDTKSDAFLVWCKTNHIPNLIWKLAYRDSESSLLAPKEGDTKSYYKYGFVNNDLSANGVIIMKKWFNSSYGVTATLTAAVNELTYTPATWVEWVTSASSVSGDETGLTLTGNGTALFAELATTLTDNTKYGLLFEIVENSISNDFGLSATSALVAVSTVLLTSYNYGQLGLKKAILTTKNPITDNKIRFYLSSLNLSGNVKIKNIRLFELPVNSDIRDKFETLSADALNTYYPYS